MSFSEFGLSPSVLKGIEDAGYTEPTPIQHQAIPIVLRGQDVLGGAQTGTGKTAAFALPMLDILATGRARARMPRSLVIEPTRELAAQVAESFALYGKYQKLSIALLVGGSSFVDQETTLNRGADVLVATPGRLLDHFERGKLLLSDIKVLVIDEADRMLDMGFIPDVERIVGLLPRSRQTLMFSATILPEIRRLARSFLVNAKEISVAPPATPVEEVRQGLAVVEADDKRAALRTLLRDEQVQKRPHLLQPQEGCRHSLSLAGETRIQRRGVARRFGAGGTHGNPQAVQAGRHRPARRQRRRRAGPRY